MPAFSFSKWGSSQFFGTGGGTVTWSVAGPGLDITDFDSASLPVLGTTSVAGSSILNFDFEASLQAAFDEWSSVANIEFLGVPDTNVDAGMTANPDIRIFFGFGDGSSSFDLYDALAYSPEPDVPIAGDILFDTADVSSFSQASFYRVALHEIGHALGLDHVADTSSIMNPIVSVDSLSVDDINGIQTIYGSPLPDQLPDLDVLITPTLSSTSVTQGDSVTLSYFVDNVGAGDVGPSTTGIYLSANSIISTADTLLTTDVTTSIGAGNFNFESVSISTSGLAPGTYYVGAIADHNDFIDEINESNNPSTGVALTITEPSVEFVLQNFKWGNAALATAGGQVRWSFATTNLATGIFQYDSFITDAVYQDLIRNAFQAWENAANIDFVEVADSATSQFRLGFDAIDGVGGTVGESSSSFSLDVNGRGSINQSAVRFELVDSGTPANPGNFFAVALHEIGHSLGLGHSANMNTIMFPTLSTQTNLAPGDIAGAQAIYGAAATADANPLDTLFDANPDIAKGLAAAYQVLLNGVPNQAGFTSLINNAVASNFGAGPGVVFNAENIFINLANSLVQGNATAAANFDTLIGGQVPLINQVTSLYNSLVPASARTVEGLAFFTRPEGLAFYTAVATERGVEGGTGPAIVAMASMANVFVRSDIAGLGNSVNDLIAAVGNNTSLLPNIGDIFTPIETADGTGFDADDISAFTIAPFATSGAVSSATFGFDFSMGETFDADMNAVEPVGVAAPDDLSP